MGEGNVAHKVARILIVDDVEANRFILRNIITDMGYQPVLAENGVQALKIVPKCNPELILLDISMPEMDGYEFCKIMKGDAGTKDIPIIFISAFDDPQDIVKGFNCGGEDYVTKPFIPEVIKARVGLHLKLYDTTQNLMEMNRRLKTSVNEQLRQMEQEKRGVLFALARVARKNSRYEEGHLERIQNNCRILAQAMQLSVLYEQVISDSYIDAIEMAAPLCDIGNVAIPIELFEKDAEELTEEERAVLRSHTVMGAELLEDICVSGDYNEFMEMSIDMARSHHENWDGSGYPDGLAGDKIPLCAQIVSLVVRYCDLTEQRAGHGPYTGEAALEIMQQEAGKMFNEDIFHICKKISRQLR